MAIYLTEVIRPLAVEDTMVFVELFPGAGKPSLRAPIPAHVCRGGYLTRILFHIGFFRHGQGRGGAVRLYIRLVEV